MNPANDWIDQARGLLDMLKQGMAASAAEGDGGEHGSDCRWCPVCQAAAVVRGERPEVSAALADVLTATAAALRSMAETDRPAAAREPADGKHADGLPADRRTGGPFDPPPTMQRIDIA